jgi:transposase
VRIVNDRDRLAAVMAQAGEAPEVVLEATYGWYWAADALAELGATVHLAHPLGVRAFSYRRVKNDERDAADLAEVVLQVAHQLVARGREPDRHPTVGARPDVIAAAGHPAAPQVAPAAAGQSN